MSNSVDGNELLQKFDKSTEDLLQTISQFSKEQINEIPFEGSWTVGQVAEHLLKSEAGLPKLFNSTTLKPFRPFDEKMNAIGSIFLDFTQKFQAPEFILPTPGQKDKQEIVESFRKSREAIKLQADKVDLSNAFPDYPFPGLGEFTGWEWIHFVTCHTIRHTRQMRKIMEHLRAKK